MPEEFTISDKTFQSRLLIGSARYPNLQVMLKAVEASKAQIVTVGLRRLKIKDCSGESVLDLLDRDRFTILPNTAGCFTARDAVLTARMAREALETNLIKLEVIGDEQTLFPDISELLLAAETLVQDGFTVLPYCNDDPVACKRLEDLGCKAVMPLGAPIGSGMGIRNIHNIQLILDSVKVPVIIDAGVGTASDAALAMELGCDGVLLNTAVAGARHPVKMAVAMRKGVEAGRLAYEAGRIPKKLFGTASTSMEGVMRIEKKVGD